MVLAGVATAFYDQGGVEHSFEEAGFADDLGNFILFSSEWLGSLGSQKASRDAGCSATAAGSRSHQQISLSGCCLAAVVSYGGCMAV